ncbi:unnamed protein product [Caenorhabditis bovis]|uniref:Phospholipid scramblase n=1 Tax=Caenorhabditis bovis TaxID=2654633 RepID=A0A8S1F9F6_9PELO|nr:unnamed protein product [Caenorhabditis bovis]
MSYIPMQPVICTQPGVQTLQAPPGTVLPMQSIPGVPQGLEYLTYLDTVIIKQKKELVEIVTNFETANRYVVMNANGQQAFFAMEESGCCSRQLCGPRRGFVMHILDNYQQEVLANECAIVSTSIGHLGSVRQQFSCCSPGYDILDANGDLVFEICGPCCCSMITCSDKDFNIKTMDGVVVGAITKKWGGCCKEAFTDADTFQVTFPLDLDVKMKAVLLGATFLIDFMHFEDANNDSKSSTALDCTR